MSFSSSNGPRWYRYLRFWRRDRTELFDVLRQDVVYAARSLRRTPAVSLTIIVTLALGLGVNAAMFSLLDVVFLRPPAGVVHPEAIRRVWSQLKAQDGVRFWSGYDYRGYAAVSRSLAGHAEVSVYGAPTRQAIAAGENPPTAGVSPASSSFFHVLGLRPLIGRFYTLDEDALDGPQPVAVVSEAFWRRELGGESSAIGRTIRLDDAPFTVIGVAPHRFTGVDLDATDVWVPFASGRTSGTVPWYRNPNVNGFQVILRLSPGAREGELEHRITAALRGPDIGFQQDTTTVGRFGSIVKANGPGKLPAEVQVATRLAGVAIIVLIIACANVVNLLLARAVKRQREIAVRLALGISRGRLVRMLVTESVLLALAAAFAALAAASWGGAALRNLLMPQVRWAESPMHWRVLAFALLGAIGAGLVAGIIPAIQSRAPDLTNALKAGAREGGARGSRLRSFLIVAQASLSVLLLVGAALFVKSLNNVRAKDIGYTVDRLAFVRLLNSKLDGATRAAQSDRLLALEPRLASIPGVEAVAYTSIRPKWGMSWIDYFPQADTIAQAKPDGMYTSVTPAFFAATGTRLLRGRTFASGSAAAGEPFPVIINEAMAAALWPREDPLGKCVRFKTPDAPCAIVIGVTQTAVLNDVTETPSPHFYLSAKHMPFKGRPASDVVLRVAPSRMSAVTAEVHALLRTEFPQLFSQTVTMAEAMEPDYRPWRLGAIVFSLFGALALVVAAIGVYSTISYAVGQRTHEFGVRAALGATAGDVLGQVLGEGLRIVAVGVAIGVVLALLGGRLIAALLYGITPSDPMALIVAAVVLLGTAAAATLAPAWRAAKADPVSSLRAE